MSSQWEVRQKRERRRARELRRRLPEREARTEGNPCEYFGYLPDLIAQGEVEALVPYTRASTQGQADNGALDDQKKALAKKLGRYGISCLPEQWDIGPGNVYKRKGLDRACALARKHNAVVVAETLSRFIRPPGYDPKDQKTWGDLPTDADYRLFMQSNPGLRFATLLLRPDATPADERAYEVKRGHRAKGNVGGRPRKKISGRGRREELMPEIIRLRAEGMGIKKIALHLRISATTVRRWLGEGTL